MMRERYSLVASIFLFSASPLVSYGDDALGENCRLFNGCSVEPFYGCELHLDATTCDDNFVNVIKRCTYLSSCPVTDCSCHCNDDDVNGGFRGVIDYYDPWRRLSPIQIRM